MPRLLPKADKGSRPEQGRYLRWCDARPLQGHLSHDGEVHATVLAYLFQHVVEEAQSGHDVTIPRRHPDSKIHIYLSPW